MHYAILTWDYSCRAQSLQEFPRPRQSQSSTEEEEGEEGWDDRRPLLLPTSQPTV